MIHETVCMRALACFSPGCASVVKNLFAGRRQRLFNGWGIFPLLFLGLAFVLLPSIALSQTTAMMSGTVLDPKGNFIVNAQVTLTNLATQESHSVKTNTSGLYAFPSLVPGSYTIKASAKGFSSGELSGIVLHAGDQLAIPAFSLSIGAETQTITVSATEEMIPIGSGQRSDVLSNESIETLALVGRDTTELLKILPGATTVSSGLTQNSPLYSSLNISVQASAVGNGVNINGAVNRGGTALLADGANVIDPGNMASSISVVNPEMTSEVTVQASNFGADVPFGPVVIQTISKSGSSQLHGEGYFNARNSVLNANDWASNHQHISQGSQKYYYPGGQVGGVVPYTHKKLFFWGGYERWLQDQGNANVLKSYIPTAAMMAGDFTTTGAGNTTLCPNGFFNSPATGYPAGPWCSDLGGTTYPDGSTSAASASLAAYGTLGGNVGQKFNSGSTWVDAGAKALAKIWPAANANPATTPGGYNYYQPIPNKNNGWLYRFRFDYQLGENTKIYGSYQQAFNSQLAQGNGAHLYWTPGNAIPYPGGGEQQQFRGKSMAGHFVHTFNSTTTMDFMAAWAFGSFPFTEPDPAAASRTGLGYTYGKVFKTSSLNIPAYSSAGAQSFPDFSQASIFDNPPGIYAVRKEAPQFNLNITKVWGAHTLKMGGFTQTTDNYQSTFATYQDGNVQIRAGQGQDADPLTTTGTTLIGSSNNPVANFVMGIMNNYGENDSSPIADTAYMATAGFLDDTWKTNKRLTLNLGIRIEHIGHWYDRNGIGMAVFYPDRVRADFNDGKYAPGFYWHATDAGVPLSGQPNRFAYANPRFGLSYDVFGKGNTVVRGGWGSYRFVTQVNDVSAPLVTAQHVLSYNMPGSRTLRLGKIADLAYTPCTSQCQSGSQSGFSPSDYGQPYTQAYNLTIDQKLKWNSQLEVAYVGSNTSQLSDSSQGITGSNFTALTDQNKMPIGALFNPDPVTHVLSVNPQNISQNPYDNLAVNNKSADYRPYGYAYGTNSVYDIKMISYTNYNALQVSWIKTAGRLSFNFNGTWSKTLGTAEQANPFNIDANYSPTSNDRTWVYNASYTYQSGRLHTGNNMLNQLGGGWIVSGISTWQSGGYIPIALGNGVPNFNMALNYTAASLPAAYDATTNPTGAKGVNNGIGTATYYGTDAPLFILPKLTCDPTKNLAHYQVLNGTCFAAPAVGSQGGQAYPYMRAAAYFNNDLAIYRTFRVVGRQQVQFRFSAFNWLNHPLPQFSGQNPLTLKYFVDYNSKAITTNYNSGSTGTNAFGVMDAKTAAPYQRIISLNVKYTF